MGVASYFNNLQGHLLDTLWKECIFILDTSVLLNLYRYTHEVREDFFKLFNKISSRLWIPHQVALEYQENRLNVIAEQLNKYSEVKKIITKVQEDFKEQITKLQLMNRHSILDPDKLTKKIDKVFKDVLREINKLEKNQPDVLDDDKIREKLDSLFNTKIGSAYNSQEKLEEIYKRGKIRYENNQPPGYMDKSKADNNKKSYIHDGLVYERAYGDLIIWYEILDEIKVKKYKYVTFITDDDKEDWWQKINSKGPKTIGPRTELINEICSQTEVKLFYMYNPERFLSYGNKYLSVQVNEKSIDEVRDMSKLRNLTADTLRDQLASGALSSVLQGINLHDQLASGALSSVLQGINLRHQLASGALSSVLQGINLRDQLASGALSSVLQGINLRDQLASGGLSSVLQDINLRHQLASGSSLADYLKNAGQSEVDLMEQEKKKDK